jgi:hypothetical protein
MNDEDKITREEALGFSSREAADNLSLDSLWNFAAAQVNALPSSPEEITRRDSNSETELSRRGCAPWQRPNW